MVWSEIGVTAAEFRAKNRPLTPQTSTVILRLEVTSWLLFALGSQGLEAT